MAMVGTYMWNKERALAHMQFLEEERKREEEWNKEHPLPTDITYKQKEFIHKIEFKFECNKNPIKFEGKTRAEASKFISDHIEEFKKYER